MQRLISAADLTNTRTAVSQAALLYKKKDKKKRPGAEASGLWLGQNKNAAACSNIPNRPASSKRTNSASSKKKLPKCRLDSSS